MSFLIKRFCGSKREAITYIVILFWISMGIFGSYNGTNFTDLAAYFISLTGFIGVYISSETKKKSRDTSIFLKGTKSKREVISYVILGIWAIVGYLLIYNQGDLLGASAYFAALTPFVGSYIIGQTFRGAKNRDENDQQINS